MWLYTKLDADEGPELPYDGVSAPFSLFLLRQRDELGDQPVLLLRGLWRDGKTLALLSDSILPTSVCEASMRTGREADPIVLLPIPPDQVHERRRAPAEGNLARLEDLLEDMMLSGYIQEQNTKLQLLPLSEVPSRVSDMWDEGPVLLKDMYEYDGLAPFVLPPGVPEVESIMSWASNRGLDCVREFKHYCPFYTNQISEVHSMYHQEMLERFGICFGKEGGYSMCHVHQVFPPLFVPTHLGELRIDVDFIGRVDTGLVPYGDSFHYDYLQHMRIGFIHMPLPQANEGDGTEVNEEDIEQCVLRSMCILSCTQQQPFYLDVTDGKSHSILYRTHNTRVTLHNGCTPTEAYYLLSGLLKGEITYGGAALDPGHFRSPACQSATSVNNAEASANADSSVMSSTINADSAEPYIEGAPNQMPIKPGADTDTSDASDSENYESSMDEEESRASLAIGIEVEEPLDLEAALEERTETLQCDGEQSESDCSEAAVSEASSDSLWTTDSDAEWLVI
ncbi:hypothetical protein COCOBI_12-4360 [Coccomyxa sp. Obi]|nr:hypothetical protein COCOBI_12-4360 [Coccomyxa sp. Obi]